MPPLKKQMERIWDGEGIALVNHKSGWMTREQALESNRGYWLTDSDWRELNLVQGEIVKMKRVKNRFQS